MKGNKIKGPIKSPKCVFVAHFRHWIAVACSNASDSLSITKVPLEAILQKMRVDDSHAQTAKQTEVKLSNVQNVSPERRKMWQRGQNRAEKLSSPQTQSVVGQTVKNDSKHNLTSLYFFH